MLSVLLVERSHDLLYKVLCVLDGFVVLLLEVRDNLTVATFINFRNAYIVIDHLVDLISKSLVCPKLIDALEPQQLWEVDDGSKRVSSDFHELLEVLKLLVLVIFDFHDDLGSQILALFCELRLNYRSLNIEVVQILKVSRILIEGTRQNLEVLLANMYVLSDLILTVQLVLRHRLNH